MDFPKAVSVGEQLLKTYPDVNAIICPDSTAFPGQAKAAENLKKSGDVIVVGFTTPSTISQYIKRGTVVQGALWDCGVQGGDMYEKSDLADARDNGIILLPERLIFTKENIDKYKF